MTIPWPDACRHDLKHECMPWAHQIVHYCTLCEYVEIEKIKPLQESVNET